MHVHIQYWCIDGKYRIYVAVLRNGGKISHINSISISTALEANTLTITPPMRLLTVEY
jgi:hypothetical protein